MTIVALLMKDIEVQEKMQGTFIGMVPEQRIHEVEFSLQQRV